MTRRDKIGLVVLISILVALGVLLALTIPRPTGPTRGFTDNVIVEQRMNNLDRNR